MSGPGEKRPKKHPGPADADRRRGIAKSLAVRVAMPKCGAKRRTDGMSCTQPVSVEGKRCQYHGGATPRGPDWHKRKPIDPNASPKKQEGKRLALRLRDKERAARLAAMTPEEREAHERRRKAAQPGRAADRARAKADRDARALLEDLRRKREAEPADGAALLTEIERLERAARELRQDGEADDNPNTGDIFG
jgi:hypothetical protein